MKKRLILLAAMSALAWVAAPGCSKNNNIDTAHVRQTFQSLSGDARLYLDEALEAIDHSNYAAAVGPLRKMGMTEKMDTNQQFVLKDTLAKVKNKAAKQK